MAAFLVFFINGAVMAAYTGISVFFCNPYGKARHFL